MEYFVDLINYLQQSYPVKEWGLYSAAAAFLLVYRSLRINRWRKILSRSIDYHKFHLSSISRDTSMDEKSRELAQALLWSATKQLPIDLARGKGGKALWRSFLGDKTSLNTCGTVYYQCARNFSFIDKVILKLNDTLISTFYRIYLLESYFSVIAVVYMDLNLLYYLVTRPKTGTGRLYLEMRSE